MSEVQFDGSPLKATLESCINVPAYFQVVRSGLEKKPDSLFWKQAFALIEKRYKKFQKSGGNEYHP